MSDVRLVYTGGGFGGARHGIPARDLTSDDLDRLRKQFGLKIGDLLDTGLYVRPEKDAPDPEEAVESVPDVGNEDGE